MFRRAGKTPELRKQKVRNNSSIFPNPGIKVEINLRVKKSMIVDFGAIPDLPMPACVIRFNQVCVASGLILLATRLR